MGARLSGGFARGAAIIYLPARDARTNPHLTMNLPLTDSHSHSQPRSASTLAKGSARVSRVPTGVSPGGGRTQNEGTQESVGRTPRALHPDSARRRVAHARRVRYPGAARSLVFALLLCAGTLNAAEPVQLAEAGKARWPV